MKTLVTGVFSLDDARRAALEALGLELTFHKDERTPVEHPEQFEAVICNGLFTFQNIEAFENLKYIQLTSAGMDRVPMDYIKAHGIEIRNAAGVYSVPMAEWTVLRLLALYKNAPVLLDNQRAARWEKDRSWLELAGRTACVVGFGAYGMETARRLKAFGMNILAVNRTVKDSPLVDAWYPLDRLDEALAEADAVILAIALTDETRDLMDRKRLGKMKPGAVLLNAARGGLVDEDALLEALDAGRLSGAALDVFRAEPLPDTSPLWRHPRVLVSPHNSFVGHHNQTRLTNIVVNNLKAVISHDPIHSCE